MKKITLSIKEYCEWKRIAEKFKILFTFHIVNASIEIEAEETILDKLGY